MGNGTIYIFTIDSEISRSMLVKWGFSTWVCWGVPHNSHVGSRLWHCAFPFQELGRISYLFSDKTGTLTCNEMHFRRLYLGASLKFTHNSLGDIVHSLHAYSRDNPHPTAATSSEAATGEQKLVSVPPKVMHDCMAKLDATVVDAIKCIALCHNVTPVETDDGGMEYQAASPDEVALVKFTESVGVPLGGVLENTLRMLREASG